MNELGTLILDFDHTPLEALPDVSAFAHLAHRVRFDNTQLPAPLPDLMARDRFPLPPPKDRENYGGDNHHTYWLAGLRDALTYKGVAERHGLELGSGTRSLELGCSTGRVLRHLRCQGEHGELWGADINARNIRWMQKFLPDDLRVFNNHWLPQLPIQDGYFDLIHSVSVFTHTDHFETGWLLELCRVLKPGGLMLHSLHTDATWNRMGDDALREDIPLYHALIRRGQEVEEARITPDTFKQPMPSPRVVFTYKGRSLYNCNTFHSREYLERVWGRFFKVEAIIPQAVGSQDLVVLRKERERTPRKTAPVSLNVPTAHQAAENLRFPHSCHFVHPESRLMYCAIPKVGCTAGKKWFLSIAEPDLVASNQSFPVHKRCEERWSLALQDAAARVRLVGECFLFAFVRDPMARIASAYTEKFTMVPRENLFAPARELADRIEATRADGRSGVSFREFVEFLCAAPNEALDSHWRPQCDFLSLRTPDLIAPIERLTETLVEFARVARRGDLMVPASNKTPYSPLQDAFLADLTSSELHARSLHPAASQLLDADLRDSLGTRYAEDIVLHETSLSRFDLKRTAQLFELASRV